MPNPIVKNGTGVNLASAVDNEDLKLSNVFLMDSLLINWKYGAKLSVASFKKSKIEWVSATTASLVALKAPDLAWNAIKSIQLNQNNIILPLFRA